MKHSEILKKRLQEDDKYKGALGTLDDETRVQIEEALFAFLDEAGAGLDGLQKLLEDSKARDEFIEALKNKRSG